MRVRSKLVIIASAAVIVAGAGTGVAFASIPDGSGVIHACYKSPPPAHGSQLNVIDTGAGGSCGGGMTALTWNQIGPQGPPGPSTAGATGLDLVLVQATGTPDAIASCPSDHPYVVSGGFSMGSASANASFPVSGTGSGTGPEGTSGNGWEASNATGSLIDVFAICAR